LSIVELWYRNYQKDGDQYKRECNDRFYYIHREPFMVRNTLGGRYIAIGLYFME